MSPFCLLFLLFFSQYFFSFPLVHHKENVTKTMHVSMAHHLVCEDGWGCSKHNSVFII